MVHKITKYPNWYIYPGLDEYTQWTIREELFTSTGEIGIIEKSVCEICDTTPDQLRSTNRKAQFNDARKIFFHLARRLYLCTNQKLGDYMGGRDHSTIVVATQKCEQFLQYDPMFKELYIRSMMKSISNLKLNGYENYQNTSKQIIKLSEINRNNYGFETKRTLTHRSK